jgi:hypothetical protein
VCLQGTSLTSYILRLRITIKKSALESVRQIIRQIPAKASVVRQPKKVDRKMIGNDTEYGTINPSFTTLPKRALLLRISHYMFRLLMSHHQVYRNIEY